MALVVLLRGINVGGHRTFRPTLLAQALKEYDVVNIGAAGTFVVRKPSPRARLRAELRSRLPVTTRFVFCEGSDLLRLYSDELVDKPSPESGTIRFVSFLANASRIRPAVTTHDSAGPRLVRARDSLDQSACRRRVPSPHEDDRLPRPARRAPRRASDHAKLEYGQRGSTDIKCRRRHNQRTDGQRANPRTPVRTAAEDEYGNA